MIKITCDPVKRAGALADRNLDFFDAALVFAGDVIEVEDDRVDYGEVRWQTIGFLHGRMVMVVWTPRGAARHVISMRKCNAREQNAYRQRFAES